MKSNARLLIALLCSLCLLSCGQKGGLTRPEATSFSAIGTQLKFGEF